MQIDIRPTNGLVRLAGLILKLVAVVMVLAMALILLIVGALTRAPGEQPGIDGRTVDFVRGADGTWVHPA